MVLKRSERRRQISLSVRFIVAMLPRTIGQATSSAHVTRGAEAQTNPCCHVYLYHYMPLPSMIYCMAMPHVGSLYTAGCNTIARISSSKLVRQTSRAS